MNIESGDLRLNNSMYKPGEQTLLIDVDLNMIDISVDECDILYLIDGAQNTVLAYDSTEAILMTTGCSLGILPLKVNCLSAIGVDRETLYIADYISDDHIGKNKSLSTSDSKARLIALSKRDFQIRWILSGLPEEGPLTKILNIECDRKGNIYILENNMGRVLFIKSNNDCGCPKPQPIEDELSNPKAISVDAEGDLYILYEQEVHIFSAGDFDKIKKKIKFSPSFSPSDIAVDPWKNIYVGDSKGKSVYKLSLSDPSQKQIYNGSNSKIVNDSKGNLHVISDNGQKLIFLDRNKLNLENENSSKGVYISKPIDSHVNNTSWHRALLEGEFEKGTQVELSYYVSNKEHSDDEIKIFKDEIWHKCILETSSFQGDRKRDALFRENVQGRYLWFKIKLTGNEKLSPVIKSINIFFPRISYVDYFPAIYKEDRVSNELLERFLAVFESIFFDIDFIIEHIAHFFDANGAPPEFLSWLGSWLAVSMDEEWPEEKKRLFIKNAVSMYKKRGTIEGLEESIELFTGKKPYIIEPFRASMAACTGTAFQSCNEETLISSPPKEKVFFFPPKEDVVKVYSGYKIAGDKGIEVPLINLLYGDERFSFSVLLEDSCSEQAIQNKVRRIIEEQKPAHTSYELKVLEPWFYLDMHTYLGINTVVKEPEFALGKTSMLGSNTILDDEEKGGQIERHSILGTDILLS